MGKKLSVVIPCYNRCEALKLTLESLCQQTIQLGDFEVIVVDQASNDGTREFIQTFEAPYTIRLIEQDQQFGPSVARNAGIEAACSSLVLLLDADMIADQRVLEAHMEFLSNFSSVLYCGRVLPYLPAYNTFIEQIVNPEAGLDRGEAIQELSFYQAFSNHISFSKETFQRIGKFDSNLRAFEDIDFAYRASQLGYPIFHNTKAISYHNHPRTLVERFEQAKTYNRMLPVIFQRYPELQGKLPILSSYETIHWRQDSGRQIASKLMVRIYGLSVIQYCFTLLLKYFDHYRCLPRLVRFLYWKLLIGNRYIGYREGLSALNQSKL